MKYSIRRKFLSPVLLSEQKVSYTPPKGIKYRVAIVDNGAVVFQFFYKKEPISPILSEIEVLPNMIVGRLATGAKVTLDFENKTFSEQFLQIKNNVAVGINNELYFIEDGGKLQKTDYTVDNFVLGKDLYKSDKLSTLIMIKDKNGKCAIFDTEKMCAVTGYDFESDKYQIENIINAEYNSDGEIMIIIKKPLDSAENNGFSNKENCYIVLTTSGKEVAKSKATGFLWQFPIVEKNENCEEKSYLLVAFKTENKKGEVNTEILKVDLDDSRVIQKIIVSSEAPFELQPYKQIAITSDNELILVTKKGTKSDSGYGAVKISKDGKVEQILPNDNDSVKVKYNVLRNPYIDYKKADKFGRISFDETTRSFEAATSAFAKMAKVCQTQKSSKNVQPNSESNQIEPIIKKVDGKQGEQPSSGDNLDNQKS